MPLNRKSNTPPKKGSKGRGAGAGTKRPFLGDSAKNDIVGVLLAILAVVLGVALLAPSSAVVARVTREVMLLCFGKGALLLPIAILVFAFTFFIDQEGPISGRVAIGLLLVVIAVLSLISINQAGVEADPSMVLDPDFVTKAGGYVGGGVAWVLLKLLGRVIGNVVLAGIVILGIVICGFSISGAISKIRAKAQVAAERHSQRRSEAAQAKAARRAAKAEEQEQAPKPKGRRKRKADVPEGQEELLDENGEAKTTYIGSRKTTVLRRPPKDAGHFDDERFDDEYLEEEGTRLIPGRKARGDEASQEEAATTLLPRRKKKGKDESQPKAATEAAPPKQQGVAVPDFLVEQAERAKAGTTAKDPADNSRPGDGEEGYELPSYSLLSTNPNSGHSAASADELDETMSRLQDTLREFGLKSRVVDYVAGPLVTTFRVEMGEGERVSKIKGLEDDIALTLAAGGVRIFAPVPGTSYVGVEITNKQRQVVHLGDVLPYVKGGPLEFAIGRDAAGSPVTADLSKMPHMLVAGTTGSGKSVALNAIIMSLVMRNTPKQVRLILVDPKQVEFSSYKGLPHLYVPVVTEPKQAASALQWAVSEMERRLKVFARAGVRDIGGYNRSATTGKLSKMENPPDPMPFIVVVIDELSDLMMTAGKEVEASIVRIAQLARAAGIHLVVATQQPTVQVVTGLIKANIDTRMALRVASGVNSRVIIDETGAERLQPRGDMLFRYAGTTRRVLGCFTSEEEVLSVVEFVASQAEADYHDEILSGVVPGKTSGEGGVPSGWDEDPLLVEAARAVVDSQLGSTSGLQRRLSVGYARAGRIMDLLAEKGVVGPAVGTKPRDVLLTKEELEDLLHYEEEFGEEE